MKLARERNSDLVFNKMGPRKSISHAISWRAVVNDVRPVHVFYAAR